MKVFIFDLLAYGENLEHLKTGSELPYPLSKQHFKADTAVHTYTEHLDAWADPLPFGYESTGIETLFRDLRDPKPRSRPVFAFHRPETLAEWLAQGATLRRRLQKMPPLITTGLRGCQIEAISNLERALAADHPRSLIQMATGSGKTFTAAAFCERLIRFAGAKRILFLVDRNTLGDQAFDEFQRFTSPYNGYRFTDEYPVQHARKNAIEPAAKVVITTTAIFTASVGG